MEVIDTDALLLRLVDTRRAGPGFPDMLEPLGLRMNRVAELGLADPSRDELSELVRLRDALLPVVLGPASEADAAEILNALIRRYEVMPQLDDAGAVVHRSARGDRVARLAEVVLPQALRLVADGDRSRVAICAAEDCAAPFVHGSSSRPRDYCSPRCSTRVRVRRHRAERAAQ